MLRFSTTLLVAALLGGAITAQKGLVTVVHAIPGLPKPVEVFANGGKLFEFDFRDSKGPLALDPATYKLEVKLDGKTVLSADAKVEADVNYTVVAHLKETSGIQLSVFVNDLSNLSTSRARVYVRHLANAPAVDVYAKRWWWKTRLFQNVSNPQEGKVDVGAGTYEFSLNAAGSRKTAFGPAKLSLSRNKVYAVHAIGKLGEESFGLFVQVIDLPVVIPKLVAKIRGKACGGAISLSTNAPEFDKKFGIILKGGTPNQIGFLHTGRSDSRFLAFRLPLSLSLLGARGCSLYQSTEHIQPVRLDGNGNVTMPAMIPKAWAPWFREIHYQYQSFRAPGKNRIGLLLTDYASIERD